MLARMAESLFWLARYLERADDTARILEVHLHHELEYGPKTPPETFLTTLGMHFPAETPTTPLELVNLLGKNREHPNSIAAAIAAARRNANGLREILPSEVYEAINVAERMLVPSAESSRGSSISAFFRYGKLAHERVATIVGIINESMPRDEGWNFLELGKFLERVDMTARLLRLRFTITATNADWVTTLRLCSAFESYLRAYHGVVNPSSILEFLLLDRQFPRSVHFGLLSAESCLAGISGGLARTTVPNPVQQLVERARTELTFRSTADISSNIEAVLENLSLTTTLASQAISERYFAATDFGAWHRRGFSGAGLI